MAKQLVAITTIDNPFDPFDDFESWFLFDVQNGYNTCAYLDRIARTTDEFTDEENQKEIEQAIDEIIENDATGIYKKIKKGEGAS